MFSAVAKLIEGLLSDVALLALGYVCFRFVLARVLGIRFPLFGRRKRPESTIYRLGTHFVNSYFEFRKSKYQERLLHKREMYKLRVQVRQNSTNSQSARVITDYLKVIK